MWKLQLTQNYRELALSARYRLILDVHHYEHSIKSYQSFIATGWKLVKFRQKKNQREDSHVP